MNLNGFSEAFLSFLALHSHHHHTSLNMNTSTFPSDRLFDLVVIGSGPAALSVVTRILESRPAALYTEEEHTHLHWLRKNGKEGESKKNGYQLAKKHKNTMTGNQRPLLKTKRVGNGNEKVLVPQNESNPQIEQCSCEGSIKILIIDRLGAWMANWDRLFNIYQIPHLRSPLFFHPAPADLDALVAFAERKGRMKIEQDTNIKDNQTDQNHSNHRRRTQSVSNNATKDFPDLIEVPGCVGKEISKHKRKKRAMQPLKRMGDVVNERDRRDYFTPSTKLFHDFIREDCVKRYGLDNDGKPWPDAKNAFDPTNLKRANENRQRIQFLRSEVCNLDWTTLHISGWEKMQGFSVELKDGIQIAAKAVVCAGGPGATPGVPDYLAKKSENHLPVTSGPGWCHSTQLGMQGRTLPPIPLQRKITSGLDSSLVVIGGGLTSAQICDVAIRKGVKDVTLLMRGYFKIKPFDLDLDWIGRYANLEKMRFWQEEDPEKRLKTMLAARQGGSITPRYAKLIKQYQQQGKLRIMTCTQVEDAQWTSSNQDDQDEGEWSLNIITTEKIKKPCKSNNSTKLGKGDSSDDDSLIEDEKDEYDFKQIKQTLHPHYIISATGAAPKFSQVPFLRNIAKKYPIPEYGGLPWLTENLQYGQLPLFCAGAFSALQIGPGAFNLEGMRAAADRIAVRLQELAIGKDQDLDQIENENEEGEEEQNKNENAKQTKIPSTESISQYTHFAYQHLAQEVEA